jgi:hypothetical protein
MSATGSNEPEAHEPVPIHVVHLAPFESIFPDQEEPQEASTATVHTPRRKIGMKKKLTPTKARPDPSSPAANTRCKMQLHLY